MKLHNIYRFIVLSDEKDSFLRIIDTCDNHTFKDLHNTIQASCDYDTSHLASFHIVNKHWFKLEELTLLDMQGFHENGKINLMENTKLSEKIQTVKQRFLYVFDILNNRALYIYLLNITRRQTLTTYLPKVVFSNGKAPLQYYYEKLCFDNPTAIHSQN